MRIGVWVLPSCADPGPSFLRRPALRSIYGASLHVSWIVLEPGTLELRISNSRSSNANSLCGQNSGRSMAHWAHDNNRGINGEARSDRYRNRGHFSRDRWGGDGECPALSPLRPCSNLYLASLYPPSRGSVRREGVPRTVPFSDPNSAEATGGGSLGYNRTVPHW
jgi:hypothetical protein